MSFYDVITLYKNFDFENFLSTVNDEYILTILEKDQIDELDFLALLSPAATKYLEKIAIKAKEIHLKRHGKSIVLFTPMYISNFCVNKCAYCSYNMTNKIKRKKMSYKQIEIEAQKIAETNLKNILILTGEDKKRSPVEYILKSIDILKKYFESISIEIYPLSTADYEKMVLAGVDCLSIYQETYDEEIYDKVHISGPKKNYKFRLDAPERALKANMRSVTIGPLIGLADWRIDSFFGGLHGKYLQKKYPAAEIGISVPRIRPCTKEFNDIKTINATELVQIILAYRLFLPYASITITTRESAFMRDNLIPLCINKISAGVSTEVGGHSLEDSGDEQFEISDRRSVDEIKKVILEKGYQPIVKNWINM